MLRSHVGHAQEFANMTLFCDSSPRDVAAFRVDVDPNRSSGRQCRVATGSTAPRVRCRRRWHAGGRTRRLSHRMAPPRRALRRVLPLARGSLAGHAPRRDSGHGRGGDRPGVPRHDRRQRSDAGTHRARAGRQDHSLAPVGAAAGTRRPRDGLTRTGVRRPRRYPPDRRGRRLLAGIRAAAFDRP